MKVYNRPKARSEAHSEISRVLDNPFRKDEERWEQWFNQLSSIQQRFVLEESCTGSGYGPDYPCPDFNLN